MKHARLIRASVVAVALGAILAYSAERLALAETIYTYGNGSVLVNPWGAPPPPPPAAAPSFYYPGPTPQPAVTAVDPGVRGGPPGVGGPMPNVNPLQAKFYAAGREQFNQVEGVPDGLGPRFNSNSCASCHLQPAIGGTSPPQNPLFQIARLDGAVNAIPWFIAPNGPIREARLRVNPDGTTNGNVHALFTIRGRRDAPGCNIQQFNFGLPGNPLTGLGGNPNVVFRIPTQVFGAGLIEAIPDSVILANLAANAGVKSSLGIGGRPNSILSGNVNRNGNDGTITRFGWKAQNKSLLIFAGEAYNVEMGVTNELFPDERDQNPTCLFNPTPENTTRFGASDPTEVLADIVAFANFMRLLAPPTPAPDTLSIVRGRAAFSTAGCAACHTPTLTTARKIPDINAALPGQPVNLYSDLLVHNMGSYLADGISQGAAGPDEFRTAPLWGLGKRVFFLHDGRTSNLLEAITAHRSPGSEANTVIDRYYGMGSVTQQDLLNFLRSL